MKNNCNWKIIIVLRFRFRIYGIRFNENGYCLRRGWMNLFEFFRFQELFDFEKQTRKKNDYANKYNALSGIKMYFWTF